MKKVVLTGVALIVGLLVSPGYAQSANPEITEWRVPWDASRPRDPYVAPDGSVWFVGQREHYVARFDPQSEEFKRYDLEPGAGPHTVIVGDDGIAWYAGNTASHIGRLDPATGEIRKIMMPDPAARDPHTMAFDASGNTIWFSVQGGNFIGKLDIPTLQVDLVPAHTANSRPYGVKMDSRNRPWVVEFGTNKLAVVNPDSMVLTEIDLPREEARPRRLVITDDDRVWYGDYAVGYLGAYDQVSGNFREWELPAGRESRPYAMAVDSRGRIWVVETGVRPNKFVGFDPANERFFAYADVMSGGGAVRHMYYDEATNSIWFGTDTNYIGRAKLPD